MRRTLTASPVHLVAGVLAVVYIWQISLTPLRTTGVQFIGPVLVILLVHLAWQTLRTGFVQGITLRVFRASMTTALAMTTAVILGALFAPKPAHADAGEIVGAVLGTLFCVAVVLLIAGIVVLIFRLVFGSVRALTGRGKGESDDPESRLFDVGSLVVAGLILTTATLEGVPGAYAFPTELRASATYTTNASPGAVWQAMETATSPDLPLPDILSMFPRPTDVTVDEGIALGAHRQVIFDGREGTGALDLTVTSRTPSVVIFTVDSDTSPYADWVTYRKLTYTVTEERDATRITLSLTYHRRLAPAWFFDPVTRAAAAQAMGVLARDVKTRAEAL